MLAGSAAVGSNQIYSRTRNEKTDEQQFFT